MRIQYKSITMVIVMGLILVMGTTAFAKGQGQRQRQRMTPEQRISHLKEVLQLSDQQVVQITPILEDAAQKKKVIFENRTTQSHGNMREQMRIIHNDAYEKITQYLIKEQKEKLKEMRFKMKEKRGKKGNRNGKRRNRK